MDSALPVLRSIKSPFEQLFIEYVIYCFLLILFILFVYFGHRLIKAKHPARWLAVTGYVFFILFSVAICLLLNAVLPVFIPSAPSNAY